MGAPVTDSQMLLDEGRAGQVLRQSRGGLGRPLRVWAGRVILGAFFIGAWQGAVTLGLVSSAFVSTPVAVVQAIDRVVSQQGFGSALDVTVEEVLVSFVASAILGVASAIILDRVSWLRETLSPYVTAANAIPRIALGPLFVLWFGIGAMSKIVLAASLGFFIVLLGTMAGLANVDRDMLLMARLYGANNRQLFFHVRLPWALPGVFSSLKLALIYCMSGAIVGEMIAARTGLGELLQSYSGQFDIAALLAVLVIVVGIVVAVTAVLTIVERRFLRWAKGSTDVPGGHPGGSE
jgi:NitT/TauT family transport system permease protein